MTGDGYPSWRVVQVIREPYRVQPSTISGSPAHLRNTPGASESPSPISESSSHIYDAPVRLRIPGPVSESPSFVSRSPPLPPPPADALQRTLTRSGYWTSAPGRAPA